MELIDIVELVLTQYVGGAALAGFLTLKGCAAVVANNFDTQEWGKTGKVIEWLGSANKKAKLTGEKDLDDQIKDAVEKKAKTKVVSKVLDLLS